MATKNSATKEPKVAVKEKDTIDLANHPINKLVTEEPKPEEKSSPEPKATVLPDLSKLPSDESSIPEEDIALIFYENENGKRVKRVLTKNVERILIETAVDLNIDMSARKEAYTELLRAYDSYIRYLVRIEFSATKTGVLEQEDIQQAAYEGFTKAVNNYDSTKAATSKFISYLYYYIKRSLSALATRFSYSTKVITTKDADSARRAIAAIRKHREPTNEDYKEIAKTLHNRTAEFVRAIDAAFYTGVTDTVTEVISTSHGDNESTFQAQDNSPNPETYTEDAQTAAALREIFFRTYENELNPFEQYIVRVRVATEFFPPARKVKLREIASTFNISIPRVRQVEQSAIKKLRVALRNFNPNPNA